MDNTPDVPSLRQRLGGDGVCGLAVFLHMAYTGSMECTPENLKDALNLADEVLINWEPSLKHSAVFDGAVKSLLWIAREEGRKELTSYE